MYTLSKVFNTTPDVLLQMSIHDYGFAKQCAAVGIEYDNLQNKTDKKGKPVHPNHDSIWKVLLRNYQTPKERKIKQREIEDFSRDKLRQLN